MAQLDKETLIDEEATTAAGDTSPASQRAEEYILVMPGETVETIAAKYGTDAQTIIDRNNINPAALLPFQGIFV